MKGFQVGVLIFFGVFVFIGVLIFSGAIDLSKKKADEGGSSGGVIIWGTVSGAGLRTSLDYLNAQNPALRIKYVEKDPRTFQSELINAYAFGGLPDLFLMSEDMIFNFGKKVVTIPFAYFPERNYDDTYARVTNIFKTTDGFLGFPIFADPLVMYYNRDLLENAGFANPPKYWSDLFEYVPKLTVRNEAQQIQKSGVALGEFSNIKNAKEIFSALVLQLENPIIGLDINGRYQNFLSSASTVSQRPFEQSLKFYNEFSDPLKSAYSWNKTMAESENAFIAGDLAIYFGLSSELENIKAKNPNLNFDIAPLPQVKELNNVITYSDVYVLAIPSTSPNVQTSLGIAADLANGANTWIIVAPSRFAPVRRDLLAKTEINKYQKVIYGAALNARSWIDPSDNETNEIFGAMIEDVSSGLLTTEKSIKKADTALKILLSK